MNRKIEVIMQFYLWPLMQSYVKVSKNHDQALSDDVDAYSPLTEFDFFKYRNDILTWCQIFSTGIERKCRGTITSELVTSSGQNDDGTNSLWVDTSSNQCLGIPYNTVCNSNATAVQLSPIGEGNIASRWEIETGNTAPKGPLVNLMRPSPAEVGKTETFSRDLH